MAAKKELITLKQAIGILNEAHGIDPEIEGRSVYSLQTLYNAISTKKLNRYGPTHMAKVDKEELLKVFGPKRAG